MMGNGTNAKTMPTKTNKYRNKETKAKHNNENKET